MPPSKQAAAGGGQGGRPLPHSTPGWPRRRRPRPPRKPRQSARRGGTSSAGRGRARCRDPGRSRSSVARWCRGAVQAAESQIGVPYVWGGELPGRLRLLRSGPVVLRPGRHRPPPHLRSPVRGDHPHPTGRHRPGDLLFYGPGGSEHVAMYIGGGTMIEAPYTGASVWVTGVRTDSGFAGVGRVG